jgi:hypothetical protein
MYRSEARASLTCCLRLDWLRAIASLHETHFSSNLSIPQHSFEHLLQQLAVVMRAFATSCRTVPKLAVRPLNSGIQSCRHIHTVPEQQFFEEQTLRKYQQKRYYPVRIGDVLNDRYKIITKLGFGAYSTVWLARDTTNNGFTSLKVGVHDPSGTTPMAKEVKTLRHLATKVDESSGSTVARLADDIFAVDGHSCIASRPQVCSFETLQRIFPESKIPKDFVMSAILRLVAYINWLAVDCGVIHTGWLDVISPQLLFTRLTKT